MLSLFAFVHLPRRKAIPAGPFPLPPGNPPPGLGGHRRAELGGAAILDWTELPVSIERSCHSGLGGALRPAGGGLRLDAARQRESKRGAGHGPPDEANAPVGKKNAPGLGAHGGRPGRMRGDGHPACRYRRTAGHYMPVSQAPRLLGAMGRSSASMRLP